MSLSTSSLKVVGLRFPPKAPEGRSPRLLTLKNLFFFQGWLHEGLGSYNEAFYVSGTVAILSALLVFGVGYMSRKQRNAILTRNREPTRGSSECSRSTSELGLKDVETQPILHEDCEVKESEIPGGIRIRNLLLVIDRETVL